jgi:hypothetical protein
MRLTWRSLPFAALLAGGAAGLVYFGPDTGSRRDSDRNSPTIAQCLRDRQSATNEELERRRQIGLQRLAVKERAVQNLLAGRLTLRQAAAQFRDAETALPVTWVPPVGAPGPGEDERLCRTVMAWARCRMARYPPAEAAAVAARLDAELEQLRGPGGAVHLPD